MHDIALLSALLNSCVCVPVRALDHGVRSSGPSVALQNDGIRKKILDIIIRSPSAGFVKRKELIAQTQKVHCTNVNTNGIKQ
jgi:hypothetical protein